MIKTPSILVIDDEPDNFDVIEALLSQQDYQLHYIASGKEAIAYLDSFHPDLILLDVMMPDMDGLEVCRRIKALPEWHHVPIIMVTALSAKSDLARCLKAGADDFISKPLNALELRARAQSMLRLKEQYDDIQSLSQMQKNTINLLESTLDTLNGNLVSTLAHELNTPLNGILGTLNFLNSSIDTLPMPEVKEMLSWMDESAQRLNQLTQKFRTFLELELLAQSPSPNPTEESHFSDVLIQSALMAHAEKMDRVADLVFTLEEATVALSERYMAMIIFELVDNALKFSSPGTPVSITSHIVDGRLTLSIHDQGRGMTNEQMSKISAFIQFERQTYEQQGTGMGLKIVQKIVEIAGGEFLIQSTYQESTTVNVSIPLICHDL